MSLERLCWFMTPRGSGGTAGLDEGKGKASRGQGVGNRKIEEGGTVIYWLCDTLKSWLRITRFCKHHSQMSNWASDLHPAVHGGLSSALPFFSPNDRSHDEAEIPGLVGTWITSSTDSRSRGIYFGIVLRCSVFPHTIYLEKRTNSSKLHYPASP